MSPVTLFSRTDGDAASADTTGTPFTAFQDSPRIKLRRTGQRPLVFEGVEVCSATTHAPGPSLWYEINLFRKKAGSIVIDVRFFSKTDAMKDRFATFFADDFDEVAHILESYQPAADVTADIPLDDDGIPTGEIALQAAVVRMRMDEAKRQFADLAGEILHQLDVQ
jgi:hypothetical protein